MGLNCGACGESLGSWPEDDVEDGRRGEVVSHKFDPPDSIAVSETVYYCDPECFVAEHGDV